MSRPLGSKNRSKFILVSVDEVLSKFNKNATIRIDASYQTLFNQNNTAFLDQKLKTEESKIEMSVS